jgi:hypothetical protein
MPGNKLTFRHGEPADADDGEVLAERRCPRCPTLTDESTCPSCGAQTVEYRVVMEDDE